MKTLLITGANGMLGHMLMNRLSDTYLVRGLDIRSADAVTPVSVSDFDALLPCFAGVEVVVHLAAATSPDASWEEVLTHNIVGTRNVFEAARVQGARRVIFASSHQSTVGYEEEEPYASVLSGARRPTEVPLIRPDMPFRPSDYYGASKAFGETLGRLYADRYGLSVLCIRIVQVNRENRPHGPRWFSHDDLEQLMRRCIEVEDISFGVYYGVSANSHAVWDLSNAERDLGYHPKDGIP